MMKLNLLEHLAQKWPSPSKIKWSKVSLVSEIIGGTSYPNVSYRLTGIFKIVELPDLRATRLGDFRLV